MLPKRGQRVAEFERISFKKLPYGGAEVLCNKLDGTRLGTVIFSLSWDGNGSFTVEWDDGQVDSYSECEYNKLVREYNG